MREPNHSSLALFRVACAVAAVSCAFTLLVGVLLLSNTLAVRMASPLNLPELDQLRATLQSSPADAAVAEKIRDLDEVVRRLYFTGLASRRTGMMLLLAGVLVALVSLQAVSVLRRRQTDPREYPAIPDRLHAESLARRAVAGMGAAVLVMAVYLGAGGSAPSRNGMNPVQDGAPAAPPGGMEFAPRPAPVALWPAFRGGTGSGVASVANPPTAWDGATGSGILWKAQVPLPGMSSPVVGGNKVYVTGASGDKREVYCYDLVSGTRLWQVEVKDVSAQPKPVPEIFQDTGYAAPTSVTDGQRVYSIFANGDVIALDHCARKLWTVDLGLPVNRYGHSASLAWYQDTVLVQYDQDVEKGKPSRLIALDAATGKTVWSTPRTVSDSWPSPVVVETATGPQLITVVNDSINAYDPRSGRELWHVKCTGADVAPSPIYAGGLVLASITGDRIYAIRPDGTGEVSASHVAWTSEDGVADVPSPVSDGELAFFVHSGGLITCLEMKTGKKVWEQNLEGEFYGSPTLVGDKLYLVARNGTVFILKAGRQFEEIAKATLGEPSDGSPVFVGDRLLIRGLKSLFCIGNKAK